MEQINYTKVINYIFDDEYNYRNYSNNNETLNQFYTKVFINTILPEFEDIKKIHPYKIAELIKIYYNGSLSKESYLKCITALIEYPEFNLIDLIFPEIMSRIESEELLDECIESLCNEHADKVQQYKNGNVKLLGFFVGNVMKRLNGIDGNLVKNKLINKFGN